MPCCGGCVEAHNLEFYDQAGTGTNNNKSSSKWEFTVNSRNSYAPNTVLEPTHLDISLDFDVPNKSLKAQVVVTIRNPLEHNPPSTALLSNIDLNGVEFDELTVTSADSNIALSHVYNGKIISVHWEKPFNPKEERKIVIKYHVTKPRAGMYFSVPDEHYKRAFYAITDHETERARHWLACVDYPVIRTTLDFHITGPATYVALANGTETGSTIHTNGIKTTHFSLKYPCPSYLICVGIGEFITVEDRPVNGMPIAYHAPKTFNPADIKRAFDKTPQMVEWISKKLSVPFPWPKYHQVVAKALGGSGAMENISLVTWGELYAMDEIWAKERQLLTDIVNLHEMAHTYFGDLVVIRHFEHAWLKESWATYMESCYLQDNVGREAFEYEMLENLDSYVAETNKYMRPIVTRCYDSSWMMFDMHLYPGGGWRLHMLRNILGESCFWTAVSDYLKTYSCKVVETEDFRKKLEQHSGINLNRFFDQWLYSKGYPKLKASYEYKKSESSVVITVEQVQANKEKEVGLFDLSLDVEVTDAEGGVYAGVVEFRDGQQKAFVVVPIRKAVPKMIRIDPNMKVLFCLEFNPGEEILLETAKKAKDILNRVRAYRELVKLGTPHVLRKVKEAVLSEPFYGVRCKVAEALSKVKTKDAAEVLAAMLDNEKEPMAMFTLAKSCTLREPVLRTALLKFLQRNDLPYRAHGGALEALAHHHNPEDVALFLKVAQDSSKVGQHGLTRIGALSALGESRSKEAFEYLLTRYQPGVELDRVRGSVYAALATVAEWQDEKDKKRVVEIIQDALREDNFGIRLSCVMALVGLGSRESIPHIEDMKKQLPEQDWPYIDRRIRLLRSIGEGGEKVQELVKGWEEVEGKLRGLEEKVFDMKKTVRSDTAEGKEKTDEETMQQQADGVKSSPI